MGLERTFALLTQIAFVLLRYLCWRCRDKNRMAINLSAKVN